ncbi:helix-hairpin-helix domain-containing protein [Bradyrhizobium diazoefficiens]
MKAAKLFAGGHELHTDRRIGKGGEGEVFAISNMPGFAVKAYLPGIGPDREKKIRAMVDIRIADNAPTVAFPHQIVVDGRGTFVGFVMRLVEKHKEIHELQTPSSRQRHFPKADYSFIVRVALNIARVFTQVHATGCVVGDINQRGILVSTNATVALIDADSFQITDGSQRFLCVVGVPEYTPPELQGKPLKSIVRTTDHDAFGLAVCLFQLLCMDRHPFSGHFTGKAEMPLEKAIAEYRFAYSSRNTGMISPPGTVRLDDFTPKVAQLFEAAFSPNHVGSRPSASTWIDALSELEASLRACSRNKLHRYARNAKECPWCRMEAEYGRPLFLDTDFTNIHVQKGRLDPAAGYILDIPALMSAINAVNIPPSISVAIPQLPSTPGRSQAAADALSKQRLGPMAKIAGVGVLLGALLALASGIPGIVAFGLAGLGGWLLFRTSSAVDELHSEYRKHATALSSHIEHLQRTSPVDRLLRKKAEALDAIDDFQKLSSAFANIRTEYDKHRKQRQLEDHLSQFSIRGARIPKVNSTDRAQLASYGFTTALDAKRRDVQQVHGIGPVKASNIAAWVRRSEDKFQFQGTYTPDDHRNIQKAQNEIITKQQGLEERLKALVGEFRQQAQDFERWKSSPDPGLVRFTQQLVQAEVDLLYVGAQLPHRPSVPPFPVPALSTFRGTRSSNLGTTFSGGSPNAPPSAQASSVNCPRCGNQMVRRMARRAPYAGRPFWGCSTYPRCTGTRSI